MYTIKIVKKKHMHDIEYWRQVFKKIKFAAKTVMHFSSQSYFQQPVSGVVAGSIGVSKGQSLYNVDIRNIPFLPWWLSSHFHVQPTEQQRNPWTCSHPLKTLDKSVAHIPQFCPRVSAQSIQKTNINNIDILYCSPKENVKYIVCKFKLQHGLCEFQFDWIFV